MECEYGYKQHGPLYGTKIDIAENMGGVIMETEKPYMTMDQLLYVVRWDNGQTSKHYAKELFCIGRFQTRVDFEKAINPTGDVELTVGPAGGFRHARLKLEYDGQIRTAEISDRGLWLECVEPLVRKRKLSITTVKLKRKG